MKVRRFEEKTQKQLNWWYSGLVDYLTEKNMVENPTCSYAMFIKQKFPQVWEKYISQVFRND